MKMILEDNGQIVSFTQTEYVNQLHIQGTRSRIPRKLTASLTGYTSVGIPSTPVDEPKVLLRAVYDEMSSATD